MTSILHCHWWEFWSHDTDVQLIFSIISFINEKLLNLNNNRSKPKLLRLLWDIVAVDLFKPTIFIQNFIFIDFRKTVLCPFLETGTSVKALMGLDQLLKCSGFSIYPLSFFLYSPFQIPAC